MKEVFEKKAVTSREFPVILFDTGEILLHPNPSCEKIYKEVLEVQEFLKFEEEIDIAVMKAVKAVMKAIRYFNVNVNVNVNINVNEQSEPDESFELKPGLSATAICPAETICPADCCVCFVDCPAETLCRGLGWLENRVFI